MPTSFFKNQNTFNYFLLKKKNKQNTSQSNNKVVLKQNFKNKLRTNEKLIVHSNKIQFCSPYMWKKIFLFKKSFVFKMIERKIFNRSSIIPSAFLNLTVKIHAGKRWHIRLVNRWMIGFKFGEFTWNRKIALYKAKQLKKLKKRKK